MNPAGEVGGALSFYSGLKLAAQVVVYAGVLGTASLSVFDLFFKQRSEPSGASSLYSLNKAGRTRLVLFIFMSVCTLAATITKDYADRQLDGFSKAAATESQGKLTSLVEETNRQILSVYSQNGDLHNQINQLGNTLGNVAAPQVAGATSACIKQDATNQLQSVNAFLQNRRARSPAFDRTMANDPQYSEKQVAYTQDTAHQYIQKFWPSIQSLIQTAFAKGITTEGMEQFSNPSYSPGDEWWQAMLYPAYDQLVYISKNAPSC